ncbi:MAG: hypothetical protein SGBAC_002214 [Bacillariaceae sp.]
MSRWAKQVKRVGRDGFQLARAIFKDSTTKRAVSFKPVLLDQARQSNMVANSLLRVDQQIGLVRYYGIVQYFQRQFRARFSSSSSLPPSTTSEGSSSATTETVAASSQPNKARIAFMITGSMKQELNEQLGYDLEADIKKMTPLQASLILHHRITPDEVEEKLSLVEEEFEKQREEDAAKQQQEAEEREKQRAAQLLDMKKAEALRKEQGEAGVQASTQASAPVSADASVQQETPVPPSSAPRPLSISALSAAADGFQSSNALLSPSSTDVNGFGESWFEVIETNSDTGESSRVGLYQEEDEAILGLETRQGIAERKETNLTFELKPVEKSAIFPSSG